MFVSLLIFRASDRSALAELENAISKAVSKSAVSAIASGFFVKSLSSKSKAELFSLTNFCVISSRLE